jgi:hypothetical protein
LKRFANVAIGLSCAFFATIFAYLTVFSLRYTCIIDPSAYLTEHILRVSDALLPNLLYLALFLLALRLFSKLKGRLSLRLITGLSLTLPLAIGLAWAFASQASPRADQAHLFKFAGQLVQGQTAELTAQGSYFQRLPYQISQLLCFELVERVFGTQNIAPFYVINALSLSLAYGAALSILWQTLRDRRAQLCACLLFTLFVPGLLYCVFVYGLLPGLALTLWGVERCVCWVRKRGAGRLLAAVALLSVACLVKINNLIPALAAAIATLLMAFHERKARFALAALCLFLLPLGVSALPKAVLSARTGATFNTGSPQSAWLMMGMQEGPRAAGWYNSYPWLVIQTAGFDTRKADAQVETDLQARIGLFKRNPAYALRFFHSKLTSQWGETTYESIWVNSAGKHSDARAAFADEVLSSPALPRYMDIYANALYLAFALGLTMLAVRLMKHNAFAANFGLLLLVVAVMGGFLYHMLFEAKSQYLLPYLVMMVPVAAAGIAQAPAPSSFPRRIRALFIHRKGVL